MNPVAKRKKKFGGLHLQLTTGEIVKISHGGEEMLIQIDGNSGRRKHSISISGPKSFVIERPQVEVADDDSV